MDPTKYEEVWEHLKEMLEIGAIQPSQLEGMIQNMIGPFGKDLGGSSKIFKLFIV